MTGLVGACLGTYQRRAWLEECLASARVATPGMPLRFYVADGGSTDGTIEMLRSMSDVCLIEQGELLGATRAYAAAYGAAIDDGADWITTLNDDLTCDTRLPIILKAVLRLAADHGLGGVAFASDRFVPRSEPDPFFDSLSAVELPKAPRCERYHGRPYLNQGVVRRSAHMAVARAQGDPSGRAYWDTKYHTYGADEAAGCWMWRLGWTIEAADDLVVHERLCHEDDVYPGEAGDEDPLRARNMALSGSTAVLFEADWGDPARLEYSREDALRYGGRVV
jgi:glycosyltransferase involved in cell wall biosynthesis